MKIPISWIANGDLILMESHAGRGAEGGEDGSCYGGDDLHDPLDGFLLCHTLSDFNGLTCFGWREWGR